MLQTAISQAIKKIVRRERDHEIAIIEKLLSEDSITIVDVGAHNGDFIERIKRNFRIKQAVLFEPIPSCFKALIEKYPDYKVLNQAVRETAGKITFNINEQKQTSSMFDFLDLEELSNVNQALQQQIQVDSTTLDTALKFLETIDLIKVDVQGAEHLVFAGGEATLSKTKVVYVEVSFKKLYRHSSDFFAIYHLLNKQGFMLREVFPGYRSAKGELLQSNAVFYNKVK